METRASHSSPCFLRVAAASAASSASKMISLSTPFSFETASTTIRISLFIIFHHLALSGATSPVRDGFFPPPRIGSSPAHHLHPHQNRHRPRASARRCNAAVLRGAPPVPHASVLRRNADNAPACAGCDPCPVRTPPAGRPPLSDPRHRAVPTAPG